MLAGIRDILVISAPDSLPLLRELLGDGGQWGLNICYRVQDRPRGIAEALVIGRDFVDGDRVALILGDNIFFGHGLAQILRQAREREEGATIFGYWVPDPERLGVVELGQNGKVLSIEEKPSRPRSNYAVTGLYFYDSQVCDLAGSIGPSDRGELEITSVNQRYLDMGQLYVRRLERGFAWIDAGTPDSLIDAANYIATIERRQGLKIGCPEEVAWRLGWITDKQLRSLADPLQGGDYGRYLNDLMDFGGSTGHASDPVQ
jgi:glucose-1-phosphate thymidylyltransferase